MAIRTITFSATANGVTPAQQYAGVEGEHNATNVVINLSDDLVAALRAEGTVYRFEIVDGLDRYDTSDNAVLAAGATSVNIDIPNGWTARGVAELRLVIAKLDAEGNNEMVLYSLPCRISFSERGTGTGATPETVEKGLSGLIADAKTATESANSAASSAINAGDYAIVRADWAERVAQTAEAKGNYAKLQGDYAKLQGDYAKEKGDYASNAAADVNTAISNATSATNAANIAASSADAAASAANTAADAANAAADAANTAADAANTAADAANTAADAAVAVGKKTPEGGEIFNSYTGSAANRATAPFSHAEGSYTTASGYASHAEGSDTTASGHVSHAEGGRTTASGDFSHAGGYYTIASAEAQTAIGKYNAEDTNALFIVGNGTTSSSRSNAFTVKLDGSATVQTQGTSNNSVIIKSTLDTALAGKQSTSITDAGGYFTADTVEGALQEIGAQLSGLDEAKDGKSLEFHWNGTQLGIRIEGEATYQYVDLKGDKGDTGERGPQGIQGPSGKSLEFTWNGTQLGVRQEGQSSYQYVNLKGEKGDKGDKGDKGEPGDIENLTSQHVITALGYSPISPTQLNSKVQTDVPVDAKFTDTVTTINGKTGAISKDDIVALGIPSQDTTYSEITTAEIDTGTASTLRTITGRRVKYILDKVQEWIGGLTKSDVGLSNVDNVKQMPISGGVLENYREKLVTLSGTSTAINLSLGNVFTHTLTGNTTYSITNAVSGQAHSFTLIITQTATVRTLTFPASVKWQDGEIPDMSTANKTYVLTFMTIDGGTTWLGMFGGEF